MFPSKDTVTPVPDDQQKMQTYIQDRRVIGVRLSLAIASHSPSSLILSPLSSYPCSSPPPTCALSPLPSSVIGLQYDPLVQPALLRHEIEPTHQSLNTIASARFGSARILAGHDERLLVVVGPCSIHSPEQALEYAKLLKSKMPEWSNLLIIMRAYLYVFPSRSRFSRNSQTPAAR